MNLGLVVFGLMTCNILVDAFQFKASERLAMNESASISSNETLDDLGGDRETRKIEDKAVAHVDDVSSGDGELYDDDEIEGRFFLKDKLCSLGLADCTPKETYKSAASINHHQIQYVQPIKVVPHGPPIAAIPVGHEDGYQSPGSSYGASGYHDSPEPNYGRPSYDAPKPSYNAPSASYGATSAGYGAPSNGYEASSIGYEAPSAGYGVSSDYAAPKPSYDAPVPSYNPPVPSYNPPVPSYNPPVSNYNSFGASHNPTSSNYYNNRFDQRQNSDLVLASDETFDSAINKRDGIHNVNHHLGPNHAEDHSHREQRRLEECYCVPIPQCPSASVVKSNGFKDYSGLIDPRTLPKSDIMAADVDELNEDTLDLSSQPGVDNNKARSLKLSDGDEKVAEIPRKTSSGDGNDSIIMKVLEKEDVPKARRRRDEISQEELLLNEEADYTDAQGRQFGPDGIRPPSCGGPSSGYVCCKTTSTNEGYTQFLETLHGSQQQTHPQGSQHQNHPQGSQQLQHLQSRPQGSQQQQLSQQHFQQQQLQQQQLNQLQQNQPVQASRFESQSESAIHQVGFSSSQFSSGNSNNNRLTNFGQCGRRNAREIAGRIAAKNSFTDGNSDFAEYPWQAAILKKEQFDNVYVCGGSLIDGSHIITAAHCVKGYQPHDLRIRAGEWDVNNDSEFYTHVEFDVTRIFLHDEYYSGNLFNDIAILRFNGYVDFTKNPHISPICLPDRFIDFSGQRCFVTGWGKDAFTQGAYQQVLKEVEVPIINSRQCEAMLRQTKLGRDFVIHPGFLCAGGEEGKDACTGDGGGPLACEVNGIWQLAGIVSWGVGCGERDVPGVYVKVSQYQDWIQEQLLRSA